VIKVCIAGKNEIAIKAIQYLTEIGYSNDQIVGLPNQYDDGKDSWQPSFRRYLEMNQIPTTKLSGLYSVEELVFISLEYDQIIETERFISKRLFNIHFSLLPKYKGMYTSAWPLLNDEKYSGVSLHLINNGIDTGQIIAQKKIYIANVQNSLALYSKYLENGIALFKKNIVQLIENTYKCTPQKAKKSTYFSRKSIVYSDLKIDLIQTAYTIVNQIRAFNFRPFQLPIIFEKQVYKAEILDETSCCKPGKLLEITDFYMVISSIDFKVKMWIDQLDNLMEAIKKNNYHIVKEIVEMTYPLNEKNNRGQTALMVAAYHGRKEIFDLLINNGANLSCKNNNGTNLLMYSIEPYLQNKDDYFINKCIELNLDIKDKDHNGKNFLDWISIRCPELMSIIKKQTAYNSKDY
jgi:methionyl-tRNA formyltransferase